MKITHISLKNWRNFRSVDVSLGQRAFLVGPNASGKSNFLDAFRFLREIAKHGGGLQESIKKRGGNSKIRCLAARQDPTIGIEVTLESNGSQSDSSWKYAIGIRQQPRGQHLPEIKYEKVLKDDKVILKRPDDNDRNDPDRLSQTHLEQINANVEFREIAKFFGSISYSHLVPQLLRHPDDFPGPAKDEDPFGKKFLEKVAQTPKKTRTSRLRIIASALEMTVPQFRHLSQIKDDRGVPHLEAVYDHWRPQGAKQGEEEFSDGTLRLIGLIWSLLERDSLLLLEEPELSLHSGIVRKLPGLMWKIQRENNRQIIISTHSPDLISNKSIGAEEVLLLTPHSEGTKIETASEIREIMDLLEGGLNIADIIISRTTPRDISQLNLFKF